METYMYLRAVVEAVNLFYDWQLPWISSAIQMNKNYLTGDQFEIMASLCVAICTLWVKMGGKTESYCSS